MFKSLSIGRRLAIGFAALALLIVAIGAFSMQRMGKMQAEVLQLTRSAVPAIRDLGRMATALAEYRVSERGLVSNADNPEKFEEYKGELATGREQFQVIADRYAAEAGAAEHEAYQDAMAAVALYFDNSQRLVDGLQAGDLGPVSAAADLRQAAADQIGVVLDHRQKDLDAAVAAQEADYAASLTAIGVLLAIALALAGAASILITRSIVRPLGEVMGAADAVARGDLDRPVTVVERSEVGALAASMREMVKTLKGYVAAQREMHEAHDAGAMSHRMPAAQFPGAYGTMAEGVNALVQSHLDTNAAAIEFVGTYARGDLSRDFERLPGEKAKITAAIDAVKQSMLDTNAEVRRLVEGAVAGDFSLRGDTQRFEFAYRELIEGLNRLMAATDAGLGEIGQLLSAVAEGDLSQRIDSGLAGRFGEVADDANRTVDRLAEIVGQIRSGSDAINSAAGEIAAGNDDLSRRTEQQAASLEETASSMEELTSTVRQNADNARQANQLAIGAVDVASQGGEVVGKVVETMSAISESSNRIADIIGVIDGIAFQTNILALNAAVEAARAGEQGRGFAVVAAEVRSLAQRSAGAAKEIKTLITDSADKVRHGNQLVDQAGRTMGEIVTSVKRVTDIIADISAASQEQSAGIEQVNQVITQMDESTQQNAALVEEATAAARSMEQQAGQLVQTVAIFRTQDGHVAPARTASPAATTTESAAAAPASVVALPRRTSSPAPASKSATRSRARSSAVLATEASGEWQEF
ncbi:methyl-accepting chemotaxis protein [Luteimonas sp. M1R5S18]|uniref:Methyl-accepting chemotaxis protein n=1 Tax=Luteimonas rhizosphaericola TaxID=3042024 RepID=A0ABT6JKZ3_9GAMM|nr:methyl-accepting chemotaxis protein [Luteimonas rhizosphaericola]MDH5831347.1 methyl-accepting chemotaxis protein [Luteimonas rhizosphaericola]